MGHDHFVSQLQQSAYPGRVHPGFKTRSGLAARHSAKISREKLELHFVHMLGSPEPTAHYLAQLADIAPREWAVRKQQISTEAKTLTKRMADQKTLDEKAVIAKLKGRGLRRRLRDREKVGHRRKWRISEKAMWR